MTEATRIVDELTRAMETDPWHGDPVVKVLEGITAERASAAPASGAHSIWQLVRHMTAWTNEVGRRLAGHPAAEPAEGDWPELSGMGERDWQRDVSALFDAHRRLVASIEPMTDAQIFEPTNDPRNRATGAGVSKYALLHGLAQHHAYHSGQIAILKKG